MQVPSDRTQIYTKIFSVIVVIQSSLFNNKIRNVSAEN